MYAKQLLAPLFTVVIAIAGFASVTAARAGEASYDYPVVLQATSSRAVVLAEAARARAAGEVPSGEVSVVVAPTTGFAKTRAQVVAETREAARLGLVIGGERSVIPTAAQLTRVELAGVQALSMTVASR